MQSSDVERFLPHLRGAARLYRLDERELVQEGVAGLLRAGDPRSWEEAAPSVSEALRALAIELAVPQVLSDVGLHERVIQAPELSDVEEAYEDLLLTADGDLRELLVALTAREQDVLRARTGAGESVNALAIRLGVSTERVRQIERRATAKRAAAQRRR